METGAGAAEEAEVAVTCLEVGAWSKMTQALAAAGGAEEEEEVVAGSTRELAVPAFPLLKCVILLNHSSKILTATNRHIWGGQLAFALDLKPEPSALAPTTGSLWWCPLPPGREL